MGKLRCCDVPRTETCSSTAFGWISAEGWSSAAALFRRAKPRGSFGPNVRQARPFVLLLEEIIDRRHRLISLQGRRRCGGHRRAGRVVLGPDVQPLEPYGE